MAYEWICVGISGCTNAGKSTLAVAIQNRFPGSMVINQDTYFRSDNSPEHVVIPELNHKNWERLESVNWDAMLVDINNILSTTPSFKPALFIIEGHIIFNHPELRKLFKKMYFITLNKEECLKRRVHRVYDPPDIPGYFELCVWPMYLSNLEDIKTHCPDVLYLNGSEKREVIQETVINDLDVFVKKLSEKKC